MGGVKCTAVTGRTCPAYTTAFTFLNEFDVLEIRLRASFDPLVDHFVLVEATRTHTGKPKPLHFTRKPQAL